MSGAVGFTELPGWAFALMLAAFAPFFARAWGKWVERRVLLRTARALALASEGFDYSARAEARGAMGRLSGSSAHADENVGVT